MTPTTFKSAMLAAARVAGCAALVACRPPVTQNNTTADDGGVVAGDTAGELLDTGEPTDASTVPETSGECLAFLDDTFEDWDWNVPITSDTVDNADVAKDCCVLVAEETADDNTWDFAHREHCCPLLDWQGPIACTPWGPPRPPAMPGVA